MLSKWKMVRRKERGVGVGGGSYDETKKRLIKTTEAEKPRVTR